MLKIYSIHVDLLFVGAVNHDFILVSAGFHLHLHRFFPSLGSILQFTVGSHHQINVICKAQVAHLPPTNGSMMIVKDFSHDVHKRC